MIWMLLYSPSQKAYHIEEHSTALRLSNNGYHCLSSFSQYDSALEYYKSLLKK